jgi:hypothetical protein
MDTDLLDPQFKSTAATLVPGSVLRNFLSHGWQQEKAM